MMSPIDDSGGEPSRKEHDAHAAWYRRMQASDDYMGMDQLQAGMAYAIFARNAFVGIWIPDKKGFLISRTKFGKRPSVFVELHWDADPSFGTAKPLRELEPCLLPLPAAGDLDAEQHDRLCDWLDALETANPPLPGWDSVGERHGSNRQWEQRLARRRDRNEQSK